MFAGSHESEARLETLLTPRFSKVSGSTMMGRNRFSGFNSRKTAQASRSVDWSPWTLLEQVLMRANIAAIQSFFEWTSAAAASNKSQRNQLKSSSSLEQINNQDDDCNYQQ